MDLEIAEEFYKKNYSGCFEKSTYLVNVMTTLVSGTNVVNRKRCNLSTFTIPHISAIVVINTTLV